MATVRPPFAALRTSRCASLLAAWCAIWCTAHALPAAAQTFKDPALQALYRAERLDELQRVATQRLAAQADDTQAVLALAVVALNRDDAAARQAAIQHAEACGEKQPRAAACQYALGSVLAVQALSEGMMKAARSAGRVKQALTQAQALEPDWYPARSLLVEFHLQAPAMMGGSSRQAAELTRSAPQPEQVRLLEARAAMLDKQLDAAQQAMLALPADLPHELADDLLNWGVQCALMRINAGQPAQARPLLERLRREHPRQAGPTYALARVRAEAGAHEDALQLYEQAAALKNADQWPLGWRIGIAQQQLGRVDAARASLGRFVAAGKGPKSALDDAKKRLAQLGAG